MLEQYNSKFILQFDDTNQKVESDEYKSTNLDDIINLLKILPDKISCTSEYFPLSLDLYKSCFLITKLTLIIKHKKKLIFKDNHLVNHHMLI